MYNYYQPQPVPQPQTNMLKGRPVSSLEEARVSPVEFDGTISFFPDMNNKRIYTKQLNKDGTCTLLMYQLTDIPETKPEEYVTREEFNKALAALKVGKAGEKFEF